VRGSGFAAFTCLEEDCEILGPKQAFLRTHGEASYKGGIIGAGILEEASGRRHHRGGAQASGRRHLGGGIKEEASGRRCFNKSYASPLKPTCS